MKKEKIEDIFSSMENFSSIPPPELWTNIEEKLDKPKKKKRAILWWSAAACLLLGLLLPTVFHIASNSGIKTINGSSTESKNVVLDKNENVKKNKNSSSENENESNNGALDNFKNTNKGNAVADSDSEINSNSAGKSENETREQNTTEAQKNSVSEKENQFNSFSRNQNKQSGKNAANQSVAQKSFMPNTSNSFNTASKNYYPDAEKRNADKALAEKTFSSGKTNGFNSALAGTTSNSIFGKTTPNSDTNNSNSVAILSDTKQSAESNLKKETGKETKSEKALAENTQKNNSKFNSSALSKQDSLQLAELQNLEKGILATTAESKKDKKEKTSEKTDKWAVQVFAGVANSENYKNEKTLGYVNDSKQGSAYGVKTKYKIAKKWAVGSGFKINELGQSVANVSYMNVRRDGLYATSDYLVQNPTVPQQSLGVNANYVLLSGTTTNSFKSENIQTGNLDQNLRYIEMPLEVSYAVFSKNKANISLNTGGFVGKLISNSVAIDGTSIGENMNANDFVYGSTLSSTVQYRVYKKTNVFVEPAINYYINPLNSQSFNQFQWGLNFGLNVSF
ncbi:hypothetical protein BD847_4180 [Flavobacterium cutihirudinis]|uniref:Outer membrane protein with beta-barrel domain n=1 Tax=Flavobacterium cutihirudinis TaxID=1265740 RepID=A0A3D9FJA5_9FLAO|nr:hypothetical protein [Flavobacterium cutihirudinis]RED18929.1 hypothetical protein BD847_4180 [Flavobacterium cutihirudinis]